jgi:hypothetical protein
MSFVIRFDGESEKEAEQVMAAAIAAGLDKSKGLTAFVKRGGRFFYGDHDGERAEYKAR